ncbi:MAG: hypothetical protein KAY37_01100 [Phycisphaerae bacterium]|nr:hypothetical protein [Phycisphaerae bacterium]
MTKMSEQINLRLTAEQRELLDRFCNDTHRHQQTVIRGALELLFRGGLKAANDLLSTALDETEETERAEADSGPPSAANDEQAEWLLTGKRPKKRRDDRPA